MSLMNLIARGFSSKTVMDYFIRKYPEHKGKIQAATAAGFGYDTLARIIDGKKAGKREEYLTDHEKTVKAHSDNRKRAAMGVVGAAGLAGAAIAGGYHYATRNRAIRPNAILPPQQGQGQIPQGGPGGGRGPQGQTINVTPQQSGTRNVPALANQQGMIPYNPQAPRGSPPSVMPSGPVIMPPYEHDPQQNVGLVKNIREDKRIMEALSSGLPMAAVTQLLRETLPKGKIHIMEKAPGGFEQVIEDFDRHRRQTTSEDTRLNQIQKINERNEKPLDIRQKESQMSNEGRGIQALRQRDQQPTPEEMMGDPQQLQQMQQMQQMNQMQDQEPIQAQQQGFDTIDQPMVPEQMQAEMQQQQDIETGKEIQRPLIDEIKKLGEQDKPLGDFDVQSALANMVITPKGVGEIKHKGKAGVIAKVDGKDSSFKPEDIEQPSEDLIEAVQNILQIPEVDRSSNIALFLYNPKDNEMFFQFHNGESYKYYDIDPDAVYRLAKKMAIPISEGKNIYGAWSQDDRQSLGAAFYQEILKNPKYKKPGKDQPANPNYQKLDTMYDYWKLLRKQPKRKKK